MKFVPAVANHLYLNLPALFSQPHKSHKGTPSTCKATVVCPTRCQLLTPDGDVDGEVGLSVCVLRLAGVPSGVALGGVADAELGGDAVQLADLGRARLARHRQVLPPVLLPLDPGMKRSACHG